MKRDGGILGHTINIGRNRKKGFEKNRAKCRRYGNQEEEPVGKESLRELRIGVRMHGQGK